MLACGAGGLEELNRQARRKGRLGYLQRDMNSHRELDLEYHARIARVYDYITNEPREYPNELLFRPIDRLIRPCDLMLDLGCGTGQMIFRYKDFASRIVAVDHSPEMIRAAKRKAREAGLADITFVEQDLDAFLKLNGNLKADLVTCVGVLHHLDNAGGGPEYYSPASHTARPSGPCRAYLRRFSATRDRGTECQKRPCQPTEGMHASRY